MRWSLGRGVGSGRCAACWSGLYRVSLSLFERRGTALPPSTPPHGPGPAAPLGLTRPSSLTAGVGEVWAPAPLPPAGSVPDGPQCAPEDSLHSHLLGGAGCTYFCFSRWDSSFERAVQGRLVRSQCPAPTPSVPFQDSVTPVGHHPPFPSPKGGEEATNVLLFRDVPSLDSSGQQKHAPCGLLCPASHRV